MLLPSEREREQREHSRQRWVPILLAGVALLALSGLGSTAGNVWVSKRPVSLGPFVLTGPRTPVLGVEFALGSAVPTARGRIWVVDETLGQILDLMPVWSWGGFSLLRR